VHLCVFSLLSPSSVDKTEEDYKGDLFKFKAWPVDRKVTDMHISSIYICEHILTLKPLYLSWPGPFL
jgi:hypothetical protein